MRTLDDLINTQDPGWPVVQEWIWSAVNQIEVLPRPNDFERAEALRAIQVTTRSPMGALVFETGGLLIDGGWLRVLGSGNERLRRTLPGWNRSVFPGNEGAFPYWLIADDVLGGFFAWDGGALGSANNVFYHAPDSLNWESMEIDYSGFLNFCFNGNLDKYYSHLRWPGWKEEISQLGGDKALSVQPLLFTRGRDVLKGRQPSSWLPISERSRAPVPVLELYQMYVNDLHVQLDGVADGATIKIVTKE